MKKILVLLSAIAIVLLVLILSACDNISKTQDVVDVAFIEAANENSILLVHRFDARVISYDITTYQVNNRMSRYNSFIVYSGNPEYGYHTAGDSIDYGFSIISLGEKRVNTELRMQPNEAIHPLAFSGEYLFFFKTRYEKPGVILDQYIVRYDPVSHILVEYETMREVGDTNMRGSITSGAIVDDKLYYTVYNEINDTFYLYETNCSDAGTVPRVQKDNLEWGYIYSQGKDLYLSDRVSIFCGDKKFTRQSENYFIGDKYLLQYVNTFDAHLDAVITDTETGKVVKTARDILDATAVENEIVLYCEGHIERFQYK